MEATLSGLKIDNLSYEPNTANVGLNMDRIERPHQRYDHPENPLFLPSQEFGFSVNFSYLALSAVLVKSLIAVQVTNELSAVRIFGEPSPCVQVMVRPFCFEPHLGV